MRILFLFLTLLSFALATVTERGSQSGKDLAKVAERWAEYWSSKQVDELVALYADDAVFHTGQGDRFSGKQVIRDIFKKALETNSSNITVESVRTEVSDKLAYDSGNYREVRGAGGDKHELTGTYVIVFRRQNGKWLIVEHVWTDKPSKT